MIALLAILMTAQADTGAAGVAFDDATEVGEEIRDRPMLPARYCGEVLGVGLMALATSAGALFARKRRRVRGGDGCDTDDDEDDKRRPAASKGATLHDLETVQTRGELSDIRRAIRARDRKVERCVSSIAQIKSEIADIKQDQRDDKIRSEMREVRSELLGVSRHLTQVADLKDLILKLNNPEGDT